MNYAIFPPQHRQTDTTEQHNAMIKTEMAIKAVISNPDAAEAAEL